MNNVNVLRVICTGVIIEVNLMTVTPPFCAHDGLFNQQVYQSNVY